MSDIEVAVADRLAGVEAELADVTARALALVSETTAAQERFRSEVVRLILFGALATAAVSAGLCVATVVVVLRT